MIPGEWNHNLCVLGPLGSPQTFLDPGRRAVLQRHQDLQMGKDFAPVFFEEWGVGESRGEGYVSPVEGIGTGQGERESAGSEACPETPLLLCSLGGSWSPVRHT